MAASFPWNGPALGFLAAAAGCFDSGAGFFSASVFSCAVPELVQAVIAASSSVNRKVLHFEFFVGLIGCGLGD
jgi:hypothetical protein